MKIADIEKQAAEIREKRETARKTIAQRKAFAEKKLKDLVAQAEALATEQRLDEYAENLEMQRQQKNIIAAADKISQRTADQVAADKKETEDFYAIAQQAFDEDVAGDIKEMLKHINAAAEAAEKYRAKLQRVNDARNTVAGAHGVSIDYSGAKSCIVLANAATALRQQVNTLQSADVHGL